MPVATLLNIVSWVFSTTLESLGVFFVYLSFLKPNIGASAIIVLIGATALVLARLPKKDYPSNGRTR
jgi:hypothetical protein